MQSTSQKEFWEYQICKLGYIKKGYFIRDGSEESVKSCEFFANLCVFL